ncbi:MAG: ATP-grasp domain-containing protein [Spirochaetaceae bacterium]|nr:ATP-grasp domain-containing protein [Spirochaetaceae bacterium]
MRSILILGAGFMQGPAIRIAKAKGYRVYAADADPNAAHAGSADEFLHIDLKDKEALAEAAAGISGLAGVFTAGTDFSASVAYVAERLGLPGIPYEAALDASDKARMRSRLREAGVPVPDYAFGDSGDDPAALAEAIGSWPVVVKPVDNMGGRGCRLARSVSELRDAWADAVAHSRSGRAIVEAYLDGPEFSLDAVVRDGRVALRGVADRVVVFEPYFVEMGHTMPTSYGREVVDEVVAVFEAGVAALGIRNGAAKGDMKYTRRGAFVGEIAARLSGGYMSGWTYPYSSGVEPTAEAIDIACGVEPAEAGTPLGLSCSERAWISIPGRVAEIRGLAEAGAMPGVRHVFPRAAVGGRVVFPSNNVQKCGNVIAVGGSAAEADGYAEAAARSILMRLEPDDEASAAFLRGEGSIRGPDGSSWPPAAFGGVSAITESSLHKLPGMVRLGGSGGSVSIAPLRGVESERALDWQGRSIPEALDAVAALTGARIGLDGDLVLGSSFWRAFLRGGYQGGAWAVERARLGDRG